LNDLGQAEGADLPRDKQAARVAIGGNHAIFPRNKLGTHDSQGSRRNKLVKASDVDGSTFGASKTILTAEYHDNKNNWTSLSSQEFGESIIKSHRPITPFYGRSSAWDPYNEPKSGGVPRFVYPALDEVDPEQYDAQHIDYGLNAVGTHHSGKAAFSFVDGHCEMLSVHDTIKQRLWGDRFFSITGPNRIDLDFNRDWD
jgi:prepilin-type processing-associated H-X9-DG protein